MKTRRPRFRQSVVSQPGIAGALLDLRLGDLWPLYLSASAGKSSASLNADGAAWRRFVNFAEDCQVRDLTRQTARDWLLWLARLRLESETVRAYLATCRRVWRLVESQHPELGGEASPLHGGAGTIAAADPETDLKAVCLRAAAIAASPLEEARRLRERQAKASGGAPVRLSELWAMYEVLKGPVAGVDAEFRDFERAAWSDLVKFAEDCPALSLSVERVACWAKGKTNKEALRVCRRVWFAAGRHYGLGDGRKLFGPKELQAASGFIC